MDVTIDDVRFYCRTAGSEQNYPLFLLHGGPGLDHTELSPWHDRLSDVFYLIYVDQRGQGRSERVDPATLSLSGFARDVTRLADALGFDQYALLGHSYGAFVTLAHAVEQGGASHYIISGGTASFAKTGPEVERNLATFEPLELREQVTESWALEPHVRTAADFARIMRMQMAFHFASTTSEAYRAYMDPATDGMRDTVFSPEVLAHFSANEYSIEFEDRLHTISSPTLVMTGKYDRTCTPRASREMHQGIPGSDLAIIPDAGHMTFIEQPEAYFRELRNFFERNPLPGQIL